MNKLKCLVVEDEPLSQEILVSYISEVPSLELVRVCNDAIEAAEVLRTTHIDLLFLDINLPKISGIRFLKTIATPPMVIFTTAYPEFAVEGFENDAVDYLVKPFPFERFLKAMNKAAERAALLTGRTTGNNQRADVPYGFLLLRSDKRVHKVNLADIRYLEATGDYIKVYLGDRCLVIHETFKNMISQLPAAHFIRVHKSFIIPIQKISYLEGNQVKIDDKLIPIGLVYKEELMKRLSQLPG
ncbi:MAG: response regulator transcription factor [bacterium]